MRRMQKITGRTDDMIILRGVNLFPTQIEEVVLRTPGLSPHFSLLLTTRGRMDHLTVRVEARPDCPPERREPAAAEVRKAVKDTVGTTRRRGRRRPGDAAAVGGQAEAADRSDRGVRSDRRRQSRRDRRRGRPGHSLDSLLDVAVAVFIERGFEATSMDELAARLGVTKSAIYHHVPSKVELLRLALDRALDALFAVTEEPGATTGRAIDRLEHVVRGSVRVLAAELPFVTLLLRVRGNSEVERAALQRRREFDRVVTGAGAGGRGGGRRPARRRPGDHQPAAVRHRQLADRVVPARRWPDAGRARRRAGDHDVRRPAHRSPDRRPLRRDGSAVIRSVTTVFRHRSAQS